MGWVMIRFRLALYLSRGTCWWFVGSGTAASLAPRRMNWPLVSHVSPVQACWSHNLLPCRRPYQVSDPRDSRSRRRKDLGQDAQGIGGIVARETAIDHIKATDNLWRGIAPVSSSCSNAAIIRKYHGKRHNKNEVLTSLDSSLEAEAVVQVCGRLKQRVPKEDNLGV